MLTRVPLRKMLVALNVSAVIAVLCLEIARAIPMTPSPEKNYRLNMTHKTAHSFNNSYDDGEESLRVEEVLMRTSDHPKIVRWRKELDRVKNSTPLEQVREVQHLINADVKYRDDYQHWHRQDKWGFPFATLDEGGDCEDFAMLKRVSLHYLGWPEDRLFLLIGYSTLGQAPETHAVLLVTLPDGSQLILDSSENHVVPPSVDHHFKPLLALQRDYLYMVGAQGPGQG